MLVTAVVLAAVLVGLGALAPRLAATAWPARSPAASLVLWQALGLSGAVLALETAGAVALAPLGATWGEALAALPDRPPAASLVVAVLAAAAVLRLLQVLATAALRTARARRRHRAVVDLVATRNPLLRGTLVVDHEVPVAYCLPGLRPRVVVSRGVLRALDEGELRAVLDHEIAHVLQRHDLVVLPFVALGSTFPRLRAVRSAQEAVALLVELLADDRAAALHDRRVLARALAKVAGGPAPEGGLGAAGTGGRDGGSAARDVLVRARRLLDPPAPLPAPALVLLGAVVAAVLALPALGLLLPGRV